MTATVNYVQLANERITSTKMYQYDHITVVSQDAINYQLAAMYKLNKTLQKLSIHLDDDDWAGIEAELGPSNVELQLGTDNRAVVFFLYLKTGKLQYWTGFGPKAKQNSVDIKDWVIALHVNLAFELKTTGFDQLPQNVRDRLKVLNDYSVQQLLIDFTSANIATRDKSRSKFTVPAEASSFFELFMNDYFTERAKNSNDSVIHYLPKVGSAQKGYAIPTIPPTDLTFQNLPFVVSASDQGKVGPNSMLVYLQMTQNHPLPRDLLAVSANWVVPSPNDTTATYDGTVALSKATFLDGWLMPKLAEFNRQSTWVTTDAWWKMDDTWTIFKSWYNLIGHMGVNSGDKVDDKPVDVNFKPAAIGDVPADVKAKVPNSDKGSWYKYACKSRKDDDHGAWRVWMEGNTNNWCFVREGFNSKGKGEICLIGKTRVDCYVHVDIPKETGWAEGNWQINLLLDGVDKGEVKIKTEPSAITPVITKDVDESLLHKDSVSPFVDRVTTGLQALSMTSIVNALTGALGGSWDFCLAGGSDFFVDKAVFNREQDLMCQLLYKTKA
jgi:hypothetical protein